MRILLFALALSLSCHADMGSIPFKKLVRLEEPEQNAIIAWNGKEQLLYLQTALSASEQTKVLEVMPLPSQPVVEETNMQVFERCLSLLPKVKVVEYKGSDSFGPFGGPPPPAALIVERKQIGAHDIRTVELLDAQRFSAWVTAEFGKETPDLVIPEPLLKVIGEYAKDGYKWFLFDVVDVQKELSNKTPLKIRFKTDKLYYPMRITRTEIGQTKVSLSILTNVTFNKEDCVGIPRSDIQVPTKPFWITAKQLEWIDPPIFELLGKPQQALLRTWTISGEINRFDKDLLVRMPAAPANGR